MEKKRGGKQKPGPKECGLGPGFARLERADLGVLGAPEEASGGQGESEVTLKPSAQGRWMESTPHGQTGQYAGRAGL